MSKLINAKDAMIRFMKKHVGGENIKIVSIEKDGESWDAKVELYEDDSFLTSMNLPTKKRRVFYFIRMDENEEVVSYERLVNEQ